MTRLINSTTDYKKMNVSSLFWDALYFITKKYPKLMINFEEVKWIVSLWQAQLN